MGKSSICDKTNPFGICITLQQFLYFENFLSILYHFTFLLSFKRFLCSTAAQIHLTTQHGELGLKMNYLPLFVGHGILPVFTLRKVTL